MFIVNFEHAVEPVDMELDSDKILCWSFSVNQIFINISKGVLLSNSTYFFRNVSCMHCFRCVPCIIWQSVKFFNATSSILEKQVQTKYSSISFWALQTICAIFLFNWAVTFLETLTLKKKWTHSFVNHLMLSIGSLEAAGIHLTFHVFLWRKESLWLMTIKNKKEAKTHSCIFDKYLYSHNLQTLVNLWHSQNITQTIVWAFSLLTAGWKGFLGRGATSITRSVCPSRLCPFGWTEIRTVIG